MFLREEELPGIDALLIRGVEVHAGALHLAVEELVAGGLIPRELRACLQPDGRLVIQTAVVQPRSLRAQVGGRLRARGVLAGMAGGVCTVVDEGEGVVFPDVVVRPQPEIVRMATAAHHLVVLDEVRLVRGLLPVARLLVGGVEALAVVVRVKKVERESSTII